MTGPVWVPASTWAFLEELQACPRGMDYVANEAEVKAAQYCDLGSAYIAFSPGNGTSYVMLLHDLIRAQAAPMADRLLKARSSGGAPGVPYEEYRYTAAEREELIASKRMEAERMHLGPAGRWGGELAVALPELGVSCVLSMPVFLMPDYLAQKLRLRGPDVDALAVYLTLFGLAVAERRTKPPANDWPPREV